MFTSTNTKISVPSLISSFPSWVHPDVRYMEPDWERLRDAYNGERAVKAKGQKYLVKYSGMEDDVYAMFLNNATFYNMVGRTVQALAGTIFKRNPIVSNLPKKLEEKLQYISIKGQTLRTFSRLAARDVIHMGRYGILVDRDGEGDPYMAGYVAEAILDWQTKMIRGRHTLTSVTLMEIQEAPANADLGLARRYVPLYRKLVLDNGVYRQEVYETIVEGTGMPSTENRLPDKVITPTNRGVPLNFIPFVFLGQDSDSVDVERSPMQDITDINFSHYRSYAQLEHGRFFTASPVYYVSKGTAEGAGEYTIGSGTVWEVGEGESAGLLEFNGHGLNALEKALTMKEAHVATLGGRMIGVESAATSESDNQLQMKDRNEQALLLNVAITLDECFTKVIRWWAMWQDVNKATADKITVEFNKEFLLKEAAAREFRAIHQMYQDGVLPIEVVYDYLHRAEVIPDWMTMEEFKTLLDSPNSFPNNPDVDANRDGLPDSKTKIQIEETEKDRENENENLEADRLAAARLQTQQIAAAKETARINAAATAAAARATAAAAAKKTTAPAKKPAAK